MNVLDLFSGIGGFSLGLERAGMRTVAFCERDEYCRAVLRKHWPTVPCFDDIHTLDAERLGGLSARVGRIDVISGGFPCQPFSVAGKQRAQGDARHLWPQMLRVIALARPAWVVGENVTGLIPLALDDVLFDLESLGYSSRTFVIPACAVDAKHRRDRVWIIAKDAVPRDRDRDRKSACAVDDEASGLCGVVADAIGAELRLEPGRSCGTSGADTTELGDDGTAQLVANPTSSGRGQGSQNARGRSEGNGAATGPGLGDERDVQHAPHDTSNRSRVRRHEPARQWRPEPDVGRGPDAFPHWLDRFVGWGMSHEESLGAVETLRRVWNCDVSQALWEAVGGLDRFSQAQILFAFVRQHSRDPNKARLLLESAEAFEGFVRGVWRAAQTASAPRRPKQGKQPAGEHPDTLQVVSRLFARNGETPWNCDSWEDGIPRVAVGVPKRVDRLRALGNAVVPQVVEAIGRAIMRCV